MTDELAIFTSLDQPLTTNHDAILELVQNSIEKAVQDHDPYIALNTIKSLVSVAKISGMGLAKGLYLLEKAWPLFELDGRFDEIAYEYVGLHSHTVERYVKVWAMYENEVVPEAFASNIQQRNIREQIPIANAIAQGYKFDEHDWESLVDAPDFSTVSRIVRDVKGQAPRSSSLQIYKDMRGSLWAYQDNEKFFIGSLEVDDDEPVVQKAIERLIKNGGVITQ